HSYIYTLSLHDALPIYARGLGLVARPYRDERIELVRDRTEFYRIGDYFATDKRGLHPLVPHSYRIVYRDRVELQGRPPRVTNPSDRKSTRLNSSHVAIS